jgi:4-hydroxybenzoate polyprenyltransferase
MIQTSKFKSWKTQIRVHHWVKNILVFVPAAANHTILEPESILNGVIVFVLFSIAASSIYLVNDLVDLESDRKNSTKRFRPLAAGEIKESQAIFVSIFLIVLGSILTVILKPSLIPVLCLYILLNLLYSFRLKKIPILDLILLAIMYEMRIIAGGISMSIELSTWLISSSSFFFLSMAFAKRYAELSNIYPISGSTNPRRGYKKEDIFILQTLGVVSSFSSVLIFNLYINDPLTTTLYSEPKRLLFLLPILTFVLSKKWLEVSRQEASEDPVIDFLRDKVNLFLVPFFLIVIMTAI